MLLFRSLAYRKTDMKIKRVCSVYVICEIMNRTKCTCTIYMKNIGSVLAFTNQWKPLEGCCNFTICIIHHIVQYYTYILLNAIINIFLAFWNFFTSYQTITSDVRYNMRTRSMVLFLFGFASIELKKVLHIVCIWL